MLFRSTFLLLFFIAITYAANSDYILALKSPVNEKSYSQARSDVESVGGKVNYEFHAAFKAVLVSLPASEVTTFSSKPYVEFMEEDKSVHIS